MFPWSWVAPVCPHYHYLLDSLLPSSLGAGLSGAAAETQNINSSLQADLALKTLNCHEYFIH